VTTVDPFTVQPVKQRGACSACGYETLLTWKGTPGFHYEQRIRGFDLEGKPKVRVGEKRCRGWNQPAEPLESEGETP
jgi:hypothetical protein